MGFVAGVHQLRNLFQSLDKDGSGSVSRFEFREFLKPYNLNLSPDALTSLVDLFDDDHDGAPLSPPPPPPPTHTPPPPLPAVLRLDFVVGLTRSCAQV